MLSSNIFSETLNQNRDQKDSKIHSKHEWFQLFEGKVFLFVFFVLIKFSRFSSDTQTEEQAMIHRTLSFLSWNSKYKIKMCQYINQMIWNIYKSFLMSGLAGQN